MMSKFAEIRITGTFYNTIRETYNSTLNSVRLNGEQGRWFLTNNGVKQGDNFTPTIFSIFINGLLQELKNSALGIKIQGNQICTLAYADDVVLVAPTQSSLQQMINIVHSLCRKWRMQMNTDKTKVMHIRGVNTPPTTYNYTCGEDTLTLVEQYHYLGYWLDSKLNVKCMSDSVSKAGERALGSVINRIKKNGDVGYLTYETLYQACVATVMDYCGGIWGITKKDQSKLINVDRVQQRGQRFYIGLGRKNPIAGLDGDLPMMTGRSRRILDGVRFYNSLILMPSQRLTKKVYEVSRAVQGCSWANSLRDILTELGFSDEWNSGEVIPPKLVKDKLRELETTQWNEELGKKPKLRTYRQIKSDRVVAQHITSNLPEAQRSLIHRLRTGTLPIELEKGRYAGLAVGDRTCKICDNGDVEDKYHLLFDCEAFSAIQSEWLNKLSLNPNRDDREWVKIFDKPYLLGKYLKDIMEKQHEILRRNKKL